MEEVLSDPPSCSSPEQAPLFDFSTLTVTEIQTLGRVLIQGAVQARAIDPAPSDSEPDPLADHVSPEAADGLVDRFKADFARHVATAPSARVGGLLLSALTSVDLTVGLLQTTPDTPAIRGFDLESATVVELRTLSRIMGRAYDRTWSSSHDTDSSPIADGLTAPLPGLVQNLYQLFSANMGAYFRRKPSERIDLFVSLARTGSAAEVSLVSASCLDIAEVYPATVIEALIEAFARDIFNETPREMVWFYLDKYMTPEEESAIDARLEAIYDGMPYLARPSDA